MHSQSFCLSAINTSPVPQCRSLNSKRGDVTTEAVGSVPSQRCWWCLSACSRDTGGMCSAVIAGLGNSCLSNTTFFLWTGQMQVSSQDSSFPWLCSCSSADWKGRTGPHVPAQVRGWKGQGVELSLLPSWLQLCRQCPACALSLAVAAAALGSVCQQTPAPSGSTQFSMGCCWWAAAEIILTPYGWDGSRQGQ